MIWRKELDFDQDWRLLGTDLVVLFCQNVGELMKPASDVRLCPMANPAYHKRDCLIAPVKCLRWLSNEYGKPEDCCCLKLADNAFWVSPGDNLNNDCTNCLIVSRNKVPCCGKQVQKISKNDSNENNTPPPITGAIGFGTRKLHKSGLLNSNSSTLGQSPSSEHKLPIWS